MLHLVAECGILSNHSLCNFNGLNHGFIESVFPKFTENKQSLLLDPEYFRKIPRRVMEPPPPPQKRSLFLLWQCHLLNHRQSIQMEQWPPFELIYSILLLLPSMSTLLDSVQHSNVLLILPQRQLFNKPKALWSLIPWWNLEESEHLAKQRLSDYQSYPEKAVK